MFVQMSSTEKVCAPHDLQPFNEHQLKTNIDFLSETTRKTTS